MSGSGGQGGPTSPSCTQKAEWSFSWVVQSPCQKLLSYQRPQKSIIQIIKVSVLHVATISANRCDLSS